MDPSPIIAGFATLMPAVDALVFGISEADARWKPESGSWSMLEIVCHLADEETEDFGPRLRATLEDPARAWTPIDPVGWATARGYNRRDLAAEVARLRAARADTLTWLPQALAGADLSRAHAHASLGTIRAGDLVAAWAAHDLLHIRQLTKRRFELVRRDAVPYSTAYAGSWSP